MELTCQTVAPAGLVSTDVIKEKEWKEDEGNRKEEEVIKLMEVSASGS